MLAAADRTILQPIELLAPNGLLAAALSIAAGLIWIDPLHPFQKVAAVRPLHVRFAGSGVVAVTPRWVSRHRSSCTLIVDRWHFKAPFRCFHRHSKTIHRSSNHRLTVSPKFLRQVFQVKRTLNVCKCRLNVTRLDISAKIDHPAFVWRP